MKWYYEVGGEQQGPVTEEAIEALYSSGVITAETKVWRKGLQEWQPASEVLSGEGSSEAAPDDVTSTAGRRVYAPHERDQMSPEERIHAFMHGLADEYQGMGEHAWTGVMHFEVVGGPSYTVEADNGVCAVYDGKVGEPTCTSTCQRLEDLLRIVDDGYEGDFTEALGMGVITETSDELMLFDSSFRSHYVRVNTIEVPKYHVCVTAVGVDLEALADVVGKIRPDMYHGDILESLSIPDFTYNLVLVTPGWSKEQATQAAQKLEAIGANTTTFTTPELFARMDTDAVYQRNLQAAMEQARAAYEAEHGEQTAPWAWIGLAIILMISAAKNC